MNDRLDDLVVVVVHHRNYEVIGTTIRSIISQGLEPEQILVVDNSDIEEKRGELVGALPSGTPVLFVRNNGYGAAVNAGVSYWRDHAAPSFVLVATHEVGPRHGAIALLRDALQTDLEAAAAGPTLISGNDVPYVWSAGGRLSPGLRIPRHYGHKDEFDENLFSRLQVAHRDWVDGAFVLYRWQSMVDYPLDETYFMYMEETDLHLRLRASGRKVLWVPSATVWQSSGGIPSYYLARNLRLLYFRAGRRKLGAIAVPVDLGRRALSDIVHRRGWRNVRDLIRGFLAPLPSAKSIDSHVILINPLGAALSHYTKELQSVLSEAGVVVDHTIAFVEPSASGRGRISWLLAYLRALLRARRIASICSAQLIVAWPALGFLDLVIVRILFGHDVFLVVHDPDPLVRGVGYGRVSMLVARALGGRVKMIVHGKVAHAALVRRNLSTELFIAQHPVLPAERRVDDATSSSSRPVLRVLGQYKADRDVSALEAIGRELGESADLEIFGRGWPSVSGWAVTEGFLSESEMAAKIRGSDVVVIPYVRFFQSGVVIRALESGVPIVGPRVPSLTDLFGTDSRLLVRSTQQGVVSVAEWVAGIEWALEHGRSEAIAAADEARRAAVDSWKKLLGESDDQVDL